ncbi:MAG: hypothetical protein ACLVC5_05355, partial [Clostridia bacterium]
MPCYQRGDQGGRCSWHADDKRQKTGTGLVRMNRENNRNFLEGKKYNIITFGCQMNEHDSETIAGMLE